MKYSNENTVLNSESLAKFIENGASRDFPEIFRLLRLNSSPNYEKQVF